MEVYKYATKNKITGQSAIKEKEFREFFEGLKIKTIVEIGTYKGISAAYMAGFAKTVFTFDVVDYPEKYKIWEDLKISKKIKYMTIRNRIELRRFLNTIKFDFAFIDTTHTYEDIKKDFILVAHCGKVLIHDVSKKKFPGITQFVKEIGAEITGNIAYWHK